MGRVVTEVVSQDLQLEGSPQRIFNWRSRLEKSFWKHQGPDELEA